MSAQQGKFTRTAKSAARSSLCFLPPVICDVGIQKNMSISLTVESRESRTPKFPKQKCEGLTHPIA